MELKTGAIVSGKVTGITKFGAFVTMADGKSGLVHISEIATAYVSDIRNHLTEGQEVTVKIIGIDASGRMNLSIKAALRQQAEGERAPVEQKSVPVPPKPSFEDKLKRFMQDSNSKISGIKQYSEKKGARRRK